MKETEPKSPSHEGNAAEQHMADEHPSLLSAADAANGATAALRDPVCGMTVIVESTHVLRQEGEAV